jgi:Zn-dependent peptidase ImmA (M78 family)
MKETIRKSTSATVIELPIVNRPLQNIPGRNGKIIKTFIPRKVDQVIKQWFSSNEMEKYEIQLRKDYIDDEAVRILLYIAANPKYNIPVYFRDFPSPLKRFTGLNWLLRNRKRVILIDNSLEDEDKRFVLAHEVGHLFHPVLVSLNTVYKTENKDVLEKYRQQEYAVSKWAMEFLYLDKEPKSKLGLLRLKQFA